ncbi:MAG: phosphatase [Oscillospiraceae bacterium]|nr:phosphatase [Oscillospiraceae bacterium]
MDRALIDLGSNSIRLSVYKCEEDRITGIFNEKEFAGLAGYVTDGVLQPAGIQKACSVINGFKDTASRFVDPSGISVFATASLRNIKNRDEAVKIIAEETLLVPDVLDGEEEAGLGFIGASDFIKSDDGIMIDIGGASTELVLFREKKAEQLVSLPIGCLNLSLGHIARIIPTERECRRMNADIAKRFSDIPWAKGVRFRNLSGIGGTLRAALRLSRVLFDSPYKENTIDADRVGELIKLLKSNRSNLYHTVYRAIPERLMTISAGLAVLRHAIEAFGCETVSVSKNGLREGYLTEKVLKKTKKHVVEQANE